jgi:hypothetical protein
MFFEHFAKWSFGYIYVLLGIMAVLSFMSVVNAQNLALSFQIQMGFPMYLVAILTSYMVSYLILTVHRRSLIVVAQKDLEDKEKVAISGIFFSKRLKIIGPLIVFLVFMLSFVLILFGINLLGLNLAYNGNLGVLTGINGQRPIFIFFLITLIVMPNLNVAPIIRAIQTLYYIISIGLPVIHLIFLAGLWFVPLTVSMQGLVFSATEILSAWSSLDVFIVSFLVLLGQLPLVSTLVSGQACVGLAGLIANPQAACYVVTPTLMSGVYVSLVGALLYVIVANIIIRAGAYVIRYRISGGIETERRKVAPDPDSFGSESSYGTPPEESYESAISNSGYGTSYNSQVSRSSRFKR